MAIVDWDRVDDIFQAALTKPADQRRAYVDRAAAGDATLAAEVLSLVAAHDASQTKAFLEPPAAAAARESARLEGSRVGPYELVRELGRGGMGEVYLGRRVDGVFQHQVAVKLTRAAVPGAEMSRRLAAERSILASLQHPHIVTLLDGGTTASGQPYLITEFIDGEPLTTYARSHRLSLDARLQLFREVCAGVHAAHLHGVVHRDLKPANILVTADGIPKILDFGIAKLLGSNLFDQTPTGGLPAPMTPSYASPEQLRGQPVTAASDVYALGVLLHELITGSRPYESEGRPLDEVLTEILSGTTTRPSAAAARRPADLPYEPAMLRGDLDAIVLKAMRVEPGGRYGSADELSQDVRRFLEGQPIVAREPSLAYLAKKLIRRHRVSTATAAVALLGIVVALGAALWQRQEAERARVAAETRFEEVRRLANALIFKLDEAVRSQSPSDARRVIVSEALHYLDGLAATSTEPGLRLELAEGYRRVGEIQSGTGTASLDDRSGAIASLRRALVLVEPLEADRALRARALAILVGIHRQMASVQSGAEALSSSRTALAIAERWVAVERSDPARNALAAAHFAMATDVERSARRAHFEAAEREYEALLAEQPDNPDRMRNVALVNKYMLDILIEAKELDAARARGERAVRLDARRVELNPTNRQARLDAAISYAQLAYLLSGKQERLAMYEKSLALRDQVAAEDPADPFAQIVLRRALAQTASARLAASDEPGARAAAERSLAMFAAPEPGLRYAGEVVWRARARLVLAAIEGRANRAASGCRLLEQAAQDIAQVSPGPGAMPGDALQAARLALPGCPEAPTDHPRR